MKFRTPTILLAGLALGLAGVSSAVAVTTTEGGQVAQHRTVGDRGHGDAVRDLLRGSYSASFDRLSPGSHHAQVKNVKRPAITGTSRVGSILHVTDGTWKPGSATLRYQWFAGGSPVRGAHGDSFTAGPGDLRDALSVVVTASKRGYRSVTVTTSPSAKVAPGVLRAIADPIVSGRMVAGNRLTASTGRWSVSKLAFGYEWLRDNKVIKGADGQRYRLTSADVGHRVSVVVAATRAGYKSADAASHRTSRVGRR